MIRYSKEACRLLLEHVCLQVLSVAVVVLSTVFSLLFKPELTYSPAKTDNIEMGNAILEPEANQWRSHLPRR
jgi:hypothetical protein